MIRKYFLFLLLIVFSVTLVGCNLVSSPTTKETPEESNTTEVTENEVISATPTPETSILESDNSDVKVFELDGGMFYFTPNEIKVKEGDTVKIVLNSVDGMHDWVVDEFNAKTEIANTGETVEVEFVADKAGTYEFYCSVGQHRANGMVGTLIVE